jgi:lipoprotein-anchoring transpeptidase ErfK/SrfK
MSRSSISLLFSSGLLLANMLTAIPTRLHAEPNTQPSLKLAPQASTTPQPQIDSASTNLVPAKTAPQQPAVRQKLESELPSAGKIRPSQNKPVTSNNLNPTAIPTAKPAVTATGTQTPVTDVVNLVLKLKEKKVYVYRGDKLITKYPVAIGKKGTETPTGEWQVMEKIKNPAWTSFKTGEVFAPGRENPLGSRWIGFWTDGKDMVGFHGTSNIKSIGRAASNGCVRMYNRHVKALFPLVKVGTTVKVVDE